ncbi:PASTA domain-containing protein [Eubacterium xylanophilum]|uniref:PASTA domain-containing protein n=1 Tax=Eubacterium xylanophilum TaxID=39497 RepID=UPI00047E49B1|nr:PASTA domain-containing protein [Eubacterium xylanophilum]
MKKIIIIMSILVLLICGCSAEKMNYEGNISSDVSSSNDINEMGGKKIVIDDYYGANLEKTIKELESKGFDNIDYEPDGYMFIFDTSNWIITKQNPESGQEVDPSSRVTFKCVKASDFDNQNESEEIVEDDDSTNKTEESKSDTVKGKLKKENKVNILKKIKGKSVSSAIRITKKHGYKAKFKHAISKMDYSIGTLKYTWPGKKLAKEVLVTKVGKINAEKKSIVLYFNSKKNIAKQNRKKRMRKVLSKRLDPISAWTAAEDYGRWNYNDSFNLHYYTMKYAERPINKKTWFLKAGCTIKSNGDKYSFTCEAKVAGTDNNPVVKYFIVY